MLKVLICFGGPKQIAPFTLTTPLLTVLYCPIEGIWDGTSEIKVKWNTIRAIYRINIHYILQWYATRPLSDFQEGRSGSLQLNKL